LQPVFELLTVPCHSHFTLHKSSFVTELLQLTHKEHNLVDALESAILIH